MYFILLIFLVLFMPLLFIYCSPSACYKRFNKLKSNSEYDSLIANYSKLIKSTPDKVVVSFTTTPDRILHTQPMLNSLLDQTVRVDQIALNIPDTLDYSIPKNCENICNIYKTGKDYGIGTKYVPTLLRESDCGTKIILIKDDVVYGKDFIEKILKESDEHPEKCIYTGNKLEGSEGILIKPEFFNDVIHNKCDDKWLENNLNTEKKQIDYNKNQNYKLT